MEGVAVGKIYDLYKKYEQEDIDHTNRDYISFLGFILALENFTKEKIGEIANYLLNNKDDFLKLDYFYNGKYFYENSIYTPYYYNGKAKYDYEVDDADKWQFDSTAAESFLEQLLDDGRVYDDFSYYFWLIDDLLQLDFLKELGIDQDFFDDYFFEYDDDYVRELIQQNKSLLKRIKILREGSADTEIQYLLNENKELANTIKEKEKTTLAEKDKQIADLTEQLAQANERIKELESQQSDTPATYQEGQGDSLLILGAVMGCIKLVAKHNYTQQSLIDSILQKYDRVSGISQSTLSKKFSEAKNYLNQRHTE